MVLPVAPAGGGNPIAFGIELVTAIFSLLFGNLFGSGFDAQKAVSQLRDSVVQLGDATYRFTWSVAVGLGAMLNAIHELFVNFLDKVWNAIKSILKALGHVFQELLPKILDFIRRLRKLLNQIYAKWIRPLMQYLSVIRRLLAILRLFHVKWAAKLDGYLVLIQSRIIGPFLWVMRQINGVANWVNLIITTRATIQRAVMIRSLWENSGSLVRISHDAQVNGTGNGTNDAPIPGAPVRSQATATADLNAYATAQAGDMAPDVDQGVQYLTGFAQLI